MAGEKVVLLLAASKVERDVKRIHTAIEMLECRMNMGMAGCLKLTQKEKRI